VLGAGAGASALALAAAPSFDDVLGLEHSAALVAAAREAGAQAERLLFRQSDPSCLPADVTAYGAVLIEPGVLEAVPSPRSVLSRMGGPRGAVAVGGVLLVACAYAWDENVTPRDAWLCQPWADSAAPQLQAALGEPGSFELEERRALPALQRISARDFSLRVLEVCVWRRVF
jgi:hypothetical protein